MERIKSFVKENWKTVTLVGAAVVIGYKLGFDKVYEAQVPESYKDDSWKRYLTGRELDINANGIYRYTFFGKEQID